MFPRGWFHFWSAGKAISGGDGDGDGDTGGVFSRSGCLLSLLLFVLLVDGGWLNVGVRWGFGGFEKLSSGMLLMGAEC